MRKYIAKIKIDDELLPRSTGLIGEVIFEKWFKNNFEGEHLFKQRQDRDFQKIDFADEKGYTYQVKTTNNSTYTFNCDIEDAMDYLKSEVYVFIQIINSYAYIEPFYCKDTVFSSLNKGKFKNDCFCFKKDLQQNYVDLDNI